MVTSEKCQRMKNREVNIEYELHCSNWHFLCPLAHQNYLGAFEPHQFLSINSSNADLIVLKWGVGSHVL